MININRYRSASFAKVLLILIFLFLGHFTKAATIGNLTIEIGETVTYTENVTIQGKVTVKGTLLITGNVTIKNGGEIIVFSDANKVNNGVLLIDGNVTAKNKAIVNNNGVVVVKGTFMENGNEKHGDLVAVGPILVTNPNGDYGGSVELPAFQKDVSADCDVPDLLCCELCNNFLGVNPDPPATVTSIKPGDWNDPKTWDIGRVPYDGDDINVNHNVWYDDSNDNPLAINPKSLTIGWNGATLTVKDDFLLNSSSVDITIYSNLIVEGNFTVNNTINTFYAHNGATFSIGKNLTLGEVEYDIKILSNWNIGTDPLNPGNFTILKAKSISSNSGCELTVGGIMDIGTVTGDININSNWTIGENTGGSFTVNKTNNLKSNTNCTFLVGGNLDIGTVTNDIYIPSFWDIQGNLTVAKANNINLHNGAGSKLEVDGDVLISEISSTLTIGWECLIYGDFDVDKVNTMNITWGSEFLILGDFELMDNTTTLNIGHNNGYPHWVVGENVLIEVDNINGLNNSAFTCGYNSEVYFLMLGGTDNVVYVFPSTPGITPEREDASEQITKRGHTFTIPAFTFNCGEYETECTACENYQDNHGQDDYEVDHPIRWEDFFGGGTTTPNYTYSGDAQPCLNGQSEPYTIAPILTNNEALKVVGGTSSVGGTTNAPIYNVIWNKDQTTHKIQIVESSDNSTVIQEWEIKGKVAPILTPFEATTP